MELAHAGVPGSHHLGEGRSCQAVVGVRVEAVGQPVHLGPPGPEVLTLPGSSQSAVEDVGVRVGESGNSDSAEAVAIVLGVSLLQAFMLEIGFMLFFLPYTMAFNWVWDTLRERVIRHRRPRQTARG